MIKNNCIKEYISEVNLLIEILECKNKSKYIKLNNNSYVTIGIDLKEIDVEDNYFNFLVEVLTTCSNIKLLINNNQKIYDILLKKGFEKKLIIVNMNILEYIQMSDILIVKQRSLHIYLTKIEKCTLFYPGSNKSLYESLVDGFSKKQKYYFNYKQEEGIVLETYMDVMKFYYKDTLPEDEYQKLIDSKSIHNEYLLERLKLIIQYPKFRERVVKQALIEYKYFALGREKSILEVL